MLTNHSFAVYADYNYVCFQTLVYCPAAADGLPPLSPIHLIVSLLLTLSPHQESSIIAMPEVVSFRNPVRSCRDPCQVKDISLS